MNPILDEALLETARRPTAIDDRAASLRAARHALIERESARHPAAASGSDRKLRDVPRRRSEPA